jgi:hypothetical protein
VTRETAGTIAFHVAFAVPGMALLYALGFVRRLREIPAAIGPAYLAGIPTVMSILLFLLVLGVGIRLPQLAVVAAATTVVLGAVGLALRRRHLADQREEPEPPASAIERWLPRVGIAALAAFFVIGISAFAEAPTVGDDWTIWSFKGVAFFHFGGELVPEVFASQGDRIGAAHQYYPVLQPLFESLYFRAGGTVLLQEWHSIHWILFGSFIWTIAWLARSRGFSPFLLLIPVTIVALTPKAHRMMETGYADITVACFVGAGALAVGLWISKGGARYAILGALFLAGAANTKNEGLMAAFAVGVVALVMLAVTRRPSWRAWLASVALFGAAVAPWLQWRSSQEKIYSQDFPGVGNVLKWDYLTDRFDRVGQSFSAVFDHLADPGHWTWIVPCLLVLAIACLITGTARREAAFYLGVATLMVFGLVFVYWTGYLDIEYWLENSSDRTAASIAYVCGAGLVHLLAIVAGPIFARPPQPADDPA